MVAHPGKNREGEIRTIKEEIEVTSYKERQELAV
jgi:hypothetical protein